METVELSVNSFSGTLLQDMSDFLGASTLDGDRKSSEKTHL